MQQLRRKQLWEQLRHHKCSNVEPVHHKCRNVEPVHMNESREWACAQKHEESLRYSIHDDMRKKQRKNQENTENMRWAQRRKNKQKNKRTWRTCAKHGQAITDRKIGEHGEHVLRVHRHLKNHRFDVFNMVHWHCHFDHWPLTLPTTCVFTLLCVFDSY